MQKVLLEYDAFNGEEIQPSKEGLSIMYSFPLKSPPQPHEEHEAGWAYLVFEREQFLTVGDLVGEGPGLLHFLRGDTQWSSDRSHPASAWQGAKSLPSA